MIVERRFSYEKGTKASDWEATARRFPLRPGQHEEMRRRLYMRLHLEEGMRGIKIFQTFRLPVIQSNGNRLGSR